MKNILCCILLLFPLSLFAKWGDPSFEGKVGGETLKFYKMSKKYIAQGNTDPEHFYVIFDDGGRSIYYKDGSNVLAYPSVWVRLGADMDSAYRSQKNGVAEDLNSFKKEHSR